MGIEGILSEASKDLKTLINLKILAVKTNQYELASKCRELELSIFPITDEEKEANERYEQIELLLRMVGISFKEKETYYKIDKALEIYKKKKGKFDVADASKIITDSEKLFLR